MNIEIIDVVTHSTQKDAKGNAKPLSVAIKEAFEGFKKSNPKAEIVSVQVSTGADLGATVTKTAMLVIGYEVKSPAKESK